MGYANELAVLIKGMERLLAAERERMGIGPGSRLSVNALDDGRVRLAVYDAGMNYVAGYEGVGTSDREGANILLTAVRPPD